MNDWCLAGHGIALKSLWDVDPDIESGALVKLMDKFYQPPTSIQMLFSPGRTQPRRVSEFAKKLAEAFTPSNSQME